MLIRLHHLQQRPHLRFLAGESLGSGRIVQITNTTVNPAVGRGTRATIGDSIYFTQGFFVYTESQSAIIGKYTDAPTVDVGFKIVQEVQSVDDNLQLYDNQGSSITLLLQAQTDTASSYD